MKTYLQVTNWGSQHHPKWLVIIRVLLGFLLLAKGIDFIKDIAQLQDILRNNKVKVNFPYFAFIIAWSHLIGGLFIIMGLFTRAVTLFQVPIVVGALFISQSGSEMVFASIVFVLLFLFLIQGSGPISMDRHYFYNSQKMAASSS